jgi:hypothetical protein|tara:strand:- start:305 stop:661 length:357 start_codon:yes stop_codon:yes gene_type:complete
MVDWEKYFRLETVESVTERVAERWEFVQGFPFPATEIPCGCGSSDFQLRSYSFWEHEKGESGMRYRCAVIMKCRDCSEVRDYVLAITKDQFDTRSQGQPASVYEWRTALELIEEGMAA